MRRPATYVLVRKGACADGDSRARMWSSRLAWRLRCSYVEQQTPMETGVLVSKGRFLGFHRRARESPVSFYRLSILPFLQNLTR
ncbi:hypothetical protein HanRHA438_Chr11g0503941 [Helianthus annuus]|nr:hypothetical protein HanRHA438_Chr11g0503941 [Helianthus annuus]